MGSRPTRSTCPTVQALFQARRARTRRAQPMSPVLRYLRSASRRHTAAAENARGGCSPASGAARRQPPPPPPQPPRAAAAGCDSLQTRMRTLSHWTSDGQQQTHHETAVGPCSAAPSPLHASCDCCRFGCPRLSGGRHQSTSNGRTPEPGSSHSPPWSSLETPLSPPAKPKRAFSERDVETEKRSGSAFRSHCGRRARATGGRRSTRRVSPGGPVPRQRSTRPCGLRFPASGACVKQMFSRR